ncbi:uncharacterized protein [Onthophagus taurus]|uniref:uncharacterized protein isoform X1 n=1 Tax=Onthophagus taurus TaxID=166361 RepID=UPI0039BE9E03
MFTSVLNLSHWDAKKAVYITEDHLKDLQDHHLDCIRSLYENYNKKIKGKLVTYPQGTNIAIIIRALLSAIIDDLKFPVLIICDSKSICLWHYEMSKIANVIVVNYEKSTINSSHIIITTLEKLKETPLDVDFSIIIGEEIETLINKVVFKRISDAPYKIGFTEKEFVDDDELKILWNIIKWVDSNLVGKLNEFIEIHKDHMNNLRDPYDHIWHRIDWDLSNYQLELANTEYKALLEEWSDRNNFISKVITQGGTKSTKRFLRDNKISPQTKKSKSTTNDFDKTNSTIHLVSLQRNNFVAKMTSSEKLTENNGRDKQLGEKKRIELRNNLKPTKLFQNMNDFIGNTTCGNKRSIQNKSRQLFKKSKSTMNETECIKNPFKKNSQKAKSTNDLDSLQTIFEKDSWIEDIMKDVDVSEISSETDTKETTKIFNCIEDMPFSLSTESKLFKEFNEDFKVVDNIDTNNEVEDFSGLVSSIITQEDEGIYPILDAIINGGPLENAVEKYKIFQENSRSQTSKERTPSPISTVTDQEGGQYPILDAIINGSPLKKAMEEYKSNVLGRRQFKDDIFPFSFKTDLQTKF